MKIENTNKRLPTKPKTNPIFKTGSNRKIWCYKCPLCSRSYIAKLYYFSSRKTAKDCLFNHMKVCSGELNQ